VNKYIVAVRALDKAIALCGVKPFHNTFFSHYSSPNIWCCALGPSKWPEPDETKTLIVLAISPTPNAQSIENWTIISQDLPASAREEYVWNHTIGDRQARTSTATRGPLKHVLERGRKAGNAETLGWEDVFDHAYSPGGISPLPPDSYS
jgi:hypothetical protein